MTNFVDLTDALESIEAAAVLRVREFITVDLMAKRHIKGDRERAEALLNALVAFEVFSIEVLSMEGEESQVVYRAWKVHPETNCRDLIRALESIQWWLKEPITIDLVANQITKGDTERAEASLKALVAFEVFSVEEEESRAVYRRKE